MAHKSLVGLALLGVLALAGCSSGDATPPPPSSAGDDEAHAGGVHWSYSGDDGSENWGALSPEFAACDTGTEQSPIAIENPKPVDRPAPEVDYSAGRSEVINTGHTVMALPGPGQLLTLGGKSFDLVQMHFHTPAENTVDGVQHAGEAHFVHDSARGKTAVFGVLLDEGGANPA